MSMMPEVLTPELCRHGVGDKTRINAIAAGYVGTHMVANMDPEALKTDLEQVPIGRLIKPEEVARLVGGIYRNEATAGEVDFIHSGLRLGSRGRSGLQEATPDGMHHYHQVHNEIIRGSAISP